MKSDQDPRAVELDQLAREEGISLPFSADHIVALENRGFVVDLVTGEIYADVVATPTRHAQAVSYLLSAD